jgi:hypothetical protein
LQHIWFQGRHHEVGQTPRHLHYHDALLPLGARSYTCVRVQALTKEAGLAEEVLPSHSFFHARAPPLSLQRTHQATPVSPPRLAHYEMPHSAGGVARKDLLFPDGAERTWRPSPSNKRTPVEMNRGRPQIDDPAENGHPDVSNTVASFSTLTVESPPASQQSRTASSVSVSPSGCQGKRVTRKLSIAAEARQSGSVFGSSIGVSDVSGPSATPRGGPSDRANGRSVAMPGSRPPPTVPSLEPAVNTPSGNSRARTTASGGTSTPKKRRVSSCAADGPAKKQTRLVEEHKVVP